MNLSQIVGMAMASLGLQSQYSEQPCQSVENPAHQYYFLILTRYFSLDFSHSKFLGNCMISSKVSEKVDFKSVNFA